MLSKRRFHFIAVNYNSSEKTLIYINSVLTLSKGNCKIVIVDNNSDSQDISKLEAYCKSIESVILIKNDKNEGYFPALNIGLTKIERGDNDYVIIGNNDLTFSHDFIEKLDSIYIEDNVLVIAPNIIKLDKIHQNPHVINDFNLVAKIYRRVFYSNYYFSIILQFIYSRLKFFKGGYDRKKNDVVMPILMGYGACYILSPNFFRHFKNLDAPVFLMGEEGILANQVLKVGGITLYHPELVVNHLDHTSIGRLPSKTLFRFSKISYRHYIKNCKYIK